MWPNVLVVPLLMAAAVVDAAPVKSRLTPKLQKTVDAVAAAYYRGDSIQVWNLLGPEVVRLKDKQLAALDQALATRQIPAVGKLLVEARMNLIRLNLPSALPKPKIRERLLLLAALQEQVDEILQATRKHPLVTGDADKPVGLKEYVDLLQQLHVLRATLLTARRSAAYAVTLPREITGRVRRRLTAEQKELIAASDQGSLQAVQEAEQTLKETELEVRLQRLKFGLEILKKPKLTPERMLAAYSTRVDARALKSAIKQAQQQIAAAKPDDDDAAEQPEAKSLFSREALKHPDLPKKVDALAAEADELAGELAAKAENLFEGLNWWLRGRYGSGPEVWGLAKSTAALNSRSGLVALNMPTVLPIPTSPTDPRRARAPQWDRRHHYTWAWEDRRLQRDVQQDGMQAENKRKLAVPHFH